MLNNTVEQNGGDFRVLLSVKTVIPMGDPDRELSDDTDYPSCQKSCSGEGGASRIALKNGAQ